MSSNAKERASSHVNYWLMTHRSAQETAHLKGIMGMIPLSDVRKVPSAVPAPKSSKIPMTAK